MMDYLNSLVTGHPTFICNFLSLVMLANLGIGNMQSERINRTEAKRAVALFAIIMACNIIDPTSYYLMFVQNSSKFLTDIGRILNYFLYIANIVGCFIFCMLIICHLSGPRLLRRIIFALPSVIGVILLLLNLRYSVLHNWSSNAIKRGSYIETYIYFFILPVFYIAFCLAYYAFCRVRGSILKSFPVLLILTPLFIAVAVELIFYSISVAWCFCAVSLNAFVTAVQNELMYKDYLTGIFNRGYLDKIDAWLHRKRFFSNKGKGYCIIMIDLNDFKSINDRFGHIEGDTALKVLARILFENVGTTGSAVRYAGDEFLMICRNTLPETVECLKRVQNSLTSFNSRARKPWKLSISAGIAHSTEEDGDLMKTIGLADTRMYESKSKFYAEHPEISRSRRVAE